MITMFLGDICPTEATVRYYEDKNINALFGDAVSLFKNRDFVFANIECAITDSDRKIQKFGCNLKAPPATARVLADLNITVAGLSNNHIFDFGRQGAIDTIKYLKEAGVDYTGFGKNYEDSRKNYTYEKDGEKICVIAVCEHEYSYALEDRMGSRPFDEFETIEDIRKAKENHARVIVVYHGGKEHCKYPSPRLMRACRAMVRNGADLVLCQHSHCIGVYEKYEGGHIVYGMGNFHFVGFCESEGWREGLAVVYDTINNSVEFIPVLEEKRGITLAKGGEKESILNSFEERSADKERWKDGWHEFCETMQAQYKHNIMRACLEDSTEIENAFFGHYLDCEAHTDVWRELFPTYNVTNERD